MSDFQTLFTDHCAMAFDKQLQLADALQDSGDWKLDLPAGALTFDSGLVLRIQLLGTEALPEAAWLWSWANALDVLPDELLQFALQIRTYGDKHSINELIEPMLSVDDRRNGHHFAMIGAALTDAYAYYRAPFDGGALFLLIESLPLPLPAVNPVERIAHVFPQLIQNVKIDNHKRAFIHYLQAYDLQVKDTETAVFGLYERDETRIHAEFDDRHRLAKLTTVMK